MIAAGNAGTKRYKRNLGEGDVYDAHLLFCICILRMPEWNSKKIAGGMKMNELFEFKDAILTVHLPQDLDHPQSDWIRKETDRIMSRTYVKRIVFDFENTEFMDSSGIGLIMGRYRALGMGQKCIMAVNTGSHIDKLLHLSGVHRYMESQRAEVDGEDYGKSK